MKKELAPLTGLAGLRRLRSKIRFMEEQLEEMMKEGKQEWRE